MVEISTSILSVKKGEESKTFFALEKAKTDYFHIDVMDGKFVEKNTYEKMLRYAEYIKRISNLPLDVHLMVKDVAKAIDDFEAVEPNIITFHYEATGDVIETINKLREMSADIMIGMSIKPLTPVDEILEYLPYLDMILVMSVEPGKGGQKFNIEALDKIEQLRRYIDENSFECLIEVDGGINGETGKDCALAGADVLVSGTYLFRSENIEKSIEKIKNID